MQAAALQPYPFLSFHTKRNICGLVAEKVVEGEHWEPRGIHRAIRNRLLDTSQKPSISSNGGRHAEDLIPRATSAFSLN
jgi:hypothetical protein